MGFMALADEEVPLIVSQNQAKSDTLYLLQSANIRILYLAAFCSIPTTATSIHVFSMIFYILSDCLNGLISFVKLKNV